MSFCRYLFTTSLFYFGVLISFIFLLPLYGTPLSGRPSLSYDEPATRRVVPTPRTGGGPDPDPFVLTGVETSVSGRGHGCPRFSRYEYTSRVLSSIGDWGLSTKGG